MEAILLTFLSFLVVILGGINWLMVGLLQYDYIAGLFGYQASIFSRILYILIGCATLILLFKAFAEKGKINLVNFKFKFLKKKKKSLAYNISNSKEKDDDISGKDYSEQDKYDYSTQTQNLNDENEKNSNPENNIFNEMG